MTKEQFEQSYAEASKLPLEKLRDMGFVAVECDCGEEGCHGWRMDANLAVANAAMMKAAGLPGNLQSLLASFLNGPVPGKKHEDMTDEERQKVREWVCEDPKVQEEKMLKAFGKAGEEMAMEREKGAIAAFLGKDVTDESA